jgi:hypothetical protein
VTTFGYSAGRAKREKGPAFRSFVKISSKAENLTHILSFLICVNGMLSCGAAFCRLESAIRTSKMEIKLLTYIRSYCN